MSEKSLAGCRRRWYDELPNVTQAIESIRKLPEDLQSLMVQHLSHYIDHYRKIRKTHQLSVGASKIKGLYTSARRSRWYDHCPAMYRAFNMMAIVPPKVLCVFSIQVLGVSDLVQVRIKESLRPNTDGIAEEVNGILVETFNCMTETQRSLRLMAGEGSDRLASDVIIGGQRIRRRREGNPLN